jgi:adenylate cyclase
MATDRSPAHYRSQALRAAYRYPVLVTIGTQINFWIVTNAVLVFVSYLTLRAASLTYTSVQPPPLLPTLGLSTATAIFYGTALGLIDTWVDRRFGARISLGWRIFWKWVFYTIAFACISTLTINVFENVLMDEWFASMGVEMTPESRFRWMLTFVPTTLAGNFLISFINQVNRSFGPGLLISLLLGRYRKPVNEERIFMFMDLRSSTAHAERLGPQVYSSMIRDLFHDIDSVVPKFEAEIYQYVGDEVVFTWNARELSDRRKCVFFFFAMRDAIQARAAYYQKAYGIVPEFKAGLHVGEVIAVEIGEIKREIAYHGDTINTAARIQAMCNEFGRSLLVSEELAGMCTNAPPAALPLRAEPLGSILLKGKTAHVTIVAIEADGPLANCEPTTANEEKAERPETVTTA